MKVSEVTSVQISKIMHKRLRIISAFTGKKLYELINESIDSLEEKYRIQNTSITNE